MTIKNASGRHLTDKEIALLEEIDNVASLMKLALDMVMEYPEADKQFAIIGKTRFQQGLTALRRSVTRPDTF